MIRRFNPSRLALYAALLAGPLPSLVGAQCVSLTTAGSPVTQNFDTLANTGTGVAWTDNSTIPGAYSTRTTYNSGTGSSNTGALYSFGAAAATDRALGSVASGGTGTVYYALCFTNNTGAGLTSVDVAYVGEQWRDGGNATPVAQSITAEYQVAATGVVTDANTPATGWTTAASLAFTSPTFAATATALDGNLAANRTAIASSLVVAVAVGEEFWLRWVDPNDAGNDHGLAVDDLSVTPQGAGGGSPVLTIGDQSQLEGDAGTTTMTFTVSLSSPAGPGGVTFDIATADNTATTADNDYLANSLSGQVIAMGDDSFTFDVTINGDMTVEADQSFFVDVTNVTGATVGDGQALGTIQNDDVAIVPIHDVQGPGASSPIVGASVTVEGVVTAVRSNGFYVQEEDAEVDADPATSEGVFVFTAGMPPAAAMVGNVVQVTGTVAEFVPSQDPLQPPLTELTSATVVMVSGGNPLPAPIPLTPTFPDPAGPFDQLERVEGMLVSVGSLTVTGPTLGNVNEPNATATSTGVFYAVVTGVARPFREAGIQAPDPAPSGSIPPIPRFDSNPERIRVDSDAIAPNLPLDVSTGTIVTTNVVPPLGPGVIVGPLDYTFRTYTILPIDPLSAGPGMTPTAVAAPTPNEVTVAAFNVQRMFDTTNDPGTSDPVLTPTAYQNRLDKASLAIRMHLGSPDILGLVEVENLGVLQDLAAQIDTDELGVDPQYQAFLVEGNDVGGIDVGFLIRTDVVDGSNPRVSGSVTQLNAAETWIDPSDGMSDLLNDRPPLLLDATVTGVSGASVALQVLLVHQRSLNGINDESASGMTTVGDRVRQKRQAQAESLAGEIQARQGNNLIVLGDFNAFEVNDGLTHAMGVVQGNPVPDNETAVPGDGVDLVTPDLVNLTSLEAAGERYSFVFDGNAQSLDHVLVNQTLVSATTARRIEHARISSDFPETDRNDLTDAVRHADHDPVVTFLEFAGLPVELQSFGIE